MNPALHNTSVAPRGMLMNPVSESIEYQPSAAIIGSKPLFGADESAKGDSRGILRMSGAQISRSSHAAASSGGMSSSINN